MSAEVYAIGDIHGCADTLIVLLNELPLNPSSTVVFLGDYVDRGPKSREVIDIILDLRRRCNVVTLKGNHEEMFEDFIADPESSQAAMFIYNGGSACLASYADDRGHVFISPTHLEFFAQLKLFHSTEEHFLVHAGVPDMDLEDIDPEQQKKILLWIRDPFFRSKYNWSKRIVHGHTPVRDVEVTARRTNIDTACTFGNYLTALRLSDGEIFQVPRQAPHEDVYLTDTESNRAAIRFKGEVELNVYTSEGTFPFQTHDYSEFGMLISPVSLDAPLLEIGEPISGLIAPNSPSPLPFSGKVVRAKRSGPEPRYALMLHRHGATKLT